MLCVYGPWYYKTEQVSLTAGSKLMKMSGWDHQNSVDLFVWVWTRSLGWKQQGPLHCLRLLWGNTGINQRLVSVPPVRASCSRQGSQGRDSFSQNLKCHRALNSIPRQWKQRSVDVVLIIQQLPLMHPLSRIRQWEQQGRGLGFLKNLCSFVA